MIAFLLVGSWYMYITQLNSSFHPLLLPFSPFPPSLGPFPFAKDLYPYVLLYLLFCSLYFKGQSRKFHKT